MKPNLPIHDPETITVARNAGAQWIRYDCKHWILAHLVWKIYRMVDGLKQQAYIGYGEVRWRESAGGDWEIGLLGERPVDGIEIEKGD